MLNALFVNVTCFIRYFFKNKNYLLFCFTTGTKKQQQQYGHLIILISC